jgi:hypothetical protein
MVVLLVLVMFVLPYAITLFRERVEQSSTTTQVDSWKLVNQRPKSWVDSRLPALIANPASASLKPTSCE